jgi:hypothetical protein
MAIQLHPLPRREAITVIKEIATEGHSPLLVIGDDYANYYVKSCKRIPDFTIISEFLCHYLLQCWQIATPEACVMRIPQERLIQGLSRNNRTGNFEWLCFGSLQIENAVDGQAFLSVESKAALKNIFNPEAIFYLALFDIWVENDDRKPTNNNLLLANSEKGARIIAIDNSYTFSTMDYRHLDPAFISSSYNDSILLSDIGAGIVKNSTIDASWYKQVENNFYLYIERCKDHFNEIVNFIPAELGFSKELQQFIYSFLFNDKRNSSVFEEFVSRMKNLQK